MERPGSLLAVHAIAEARVVDELHEVLTVPGRALALHVVQDTETRATSGWWETEDRAWLAATTVGEA